MNDCIAAVEDAKRKKKTAQETYKAMYLLFIKFCENNLKKTVQELSQVEHVFA